MARFSCSHLSDHALLRDLRLIVSRDRATTAELVAHLGEVQQRRLYADAGYPSMTAYCVQALRMDEFSAERRLRAARVARDFPQVLELLGSGRLHLTAVLQLAPRLTRANAAGLLAAAAGKSREQVAELLAQRFPREDVPTQLLPIASSAQTLHDNACKLPAPALVNLSHPLLEAGAQAGGNAGTSSDVRCCPALGSSTPAPAPAPRASVKPLAPERFELRVTLPQATRDKLQRAQELLGHAIAPGDVAAVLDRALELLIAREEKRRYGKGATPGRNSAPRQPGPPRTPRATRVLRKPARRSRYLPLDVRREVTQRDGEQCTFVGSNGHRCQARAGLQFDHIRPFARGGENTVANLRLRCSAHNQREAERVFGAGFMDAKRESPRSGPATCAAP